MPTDIKERNEVVSSTFSGKDLPQFPQYYMPYAEHRAAAGQAAKPLAELKKLNPERGAEIDDTLLKIGRNSGRAEADVGYLPLRAKYQDQAVLVGKNDGQVLAVLRIQPW
jgi:hypothetical protein